MSIMRMNMGQKASAKNITKTAFQTQTSSLKAHDRPGAQRVAPENTTEDSQTGQSSPRGGTRLMKVVEAGGSDTNANEEVHATASQSSKGDDGHSQMRELGKTIQALRSNTGMVEDQVWMRRFNLAMGATIVSNIIVIAIETDAGYDEAGSIEGKIAWIIIDSLFILIFMFEIAVRAWIERWEWLRSAWNWFDVLVILIAMVDIWIISFLQGELGNLYVISIFRIIRLVRLVRLVKLVRLLHGLYVILTAFWHAMQTMSFLLAIMAFGLLIYSIFATNLIGRNAGLKNVRIHEEPVAKRFGTVYRSMYSLFELMTLEGWESVARPIVEEQPYLFLFIVSFIMIFTFGMLNMIVALVIEKTLHHTRMMSEHEVATERVRLADELLRVQEMFNNGNAKEGKISFEEFQNALKESEAMWDVFSKMGIAMSDVRELYSVLDWDESGELSVKEFLDGLQRLQDGVCSPWDSLATHAIVRNIKGKVIDLSADVVRLAEAQEAARVKQEAWRLRVDERLDQQREALQECLSRLTTLVSRTSSPTRKTARPTRGTSSATTNAELLASER